ncbi:MAG: hypothetical protein WC450_03955 [Candidatus Omnitrophota bacterium]|jgi:hypothetical protein
MNPFRKDATFPVKLLVIAGILLIPLVLTVLICRPIIAQHMSRSIAVHYRLPDDFKKADVERMVWHMGQEPEYAFYFRALSADDLKNFVDDVYSLLNTRRGREFHSKLVREMQSSVEDMAVLINTLSLPDNMTAESHPDIIVMFWKFFLKEFQTTVVGLCYKATYDQDFRLEWSPEARSAARKLKDVFTSLEQRPSPSN